jgi:acyl-coenzyme A thioesterase PaaI-like protein
LRAAISLETKFLYPVKKGMVTAKARVANQGCRILQGQSTVFNEDERPVVKFSSTFKIAKDTTIRKITFQNGGYIDARISQG